MKPGDTFTREDGKLYRLTEKGTIEEIGWDLEQVRLHRKRKETNLEPEMWFDEPPDGLG